MDPSDQALGRQMVRTVGLFQALVALPTLVILGFCAFYQLLDPYYMSFYDFFTDSITSLMAMGIVFVVILQRKVRPNDFLTFEFECAKSILATGLWIWLILDAAFGPWQRGKSGYERLREMRVARASVAVIVLLILFYPPLIYSFLLWKGKHDLEREAAHDQGEERESRDERRPLLSA